MTDECLSFIYSMFNIYKNEIDGKFLNQFTRYGRNALLNLCEDYALHIYEKLYFIIKNNYLKYERESLLQKNASTLYIDASKTIKISYEDLNKFVIQIFYPLIEEFIKRGADINCCTAEKQFINNDSKFEEYKYFNNYGKIYPIMYLIAYPCSTELIKMIKKYKININCIDLKKQTLLMYLFKAELQIRKISEDNYYKMYNFLIDNCNNLLLENVEGETLFFKEIESNNEEQALIIYNKLGEKNLDINFPYYDNLTLLGKAVIDRDENLIDFLLSNFKEINPNKIDVEYNRNVLHYICMRASSKKEENYNEFLKWINLGTSLTQKDNYNRNPLFYLFIEEEEDIKKDDPISILSFLLETYYNKNKKKFDIDSIDNLGNTLIFYAIKANASFCISSLLNYGAKINNIKNYANNSIFSYCLLYDSSSLSELYSKVNNPKIFEDKIYKEYAIRMIDKPKESINKNLGKESLHNKELPNLPTNKKVSDKNEIKFCVEEIFRADERYNYESTREKFVTEKDNNLKQLFDENDEGTNIEFLGYNDNDNDIYADYWNVPVEENNAKITIKNKKDDDLNNDMEEDENEDNNSFIADDDDDSHSIDNKSSNVLKFYKNLKKEEKVNKEINNKDLDLDLSEVSSITKYKEEIIIKEIKNKRKRKIELSKVKKNTYFFNYISYFNDLLDRRINNYFGDDNYHYRKNYAPIIEKKKIIIEKNYPEIKSTYYNISLSSFNKSYEKESKKIYKKKIDYDLISDSLFKYCLEKSKQNIIYYILNQGYDQFKAIADSLTSYKYNFCLLLLNRFNLSSNTFKAKTSKGQNLLHILAENCTFKSSESNTFNEIKKIYDIFINKIKLDISEYDSDKHTPLYYAVENENIDLIKLITDNMNEKKYSLFLQKDNKNKDNCSPLMLLYDKITLSLDSNNYSLLKIINLVTKKTKIGYWRNVAEYLLRNYNDENIKLDEYNRLDINKELKKILKIYRCLIDECNINIMTDIDDNENDIFLLSAQKNKLYLFKNLLLKEKNIKYNKVNKEGKSVIHLLVTPNGAFSYQNKEFLKLALNAGFSSKIKDKNGLTPLDYAKKNKYLDFIDILSDSKSKTKHLKKTICNDDDSYMNIEDVENNYIKNINYNYDEMYKKYYKEIITPYINKKIKIKDKTRTEIVKNCGLKIRHYHIYKDDNDCLYNIKMAKVDIKKNLYGKFVFYHMQLLVNDKRKMYNLITRWGRFGDEGQYQNTPFSDINEAIKEFRKVFKMKTGNKWEDVKLDFNNFEKKEKKYRLLKFTDQKPEIYNIMYYFNNELPNIYFTLNKKNFELLEKMIHPNTKQFIINIIKTAFKYKITNKKNIYHDSEDEDDDDDDNSNGINILYFPKETIEEGYKILSELENIIQRIDILKKENEKLKLKITEKSLEDPNSPYNLNIKEYRETNQKLVELSNLYFETIPFNEKRNYEIEPIDSSSKIKYEIERLYSFTYIENTIKLFLSSLYYNRLIEPISYIYKALNKKIIPLNLDLSSKDNKDMHLVNILIRYIRWNDKNSLNLKYGIKNIFEIFDENQKKWEDNNIGKRIMLFHGTKTENMLGILSKGLLISPFESEISGNKYGNGIYLSDRFKKSSDYCSDGNKKYILLVDTFLDKVFKESETNIFKNSKELKEKGYNCFISKSKYSINFNANIYLNNGSTIPTILHKNEDRRYAPDYSEYVIYDPKLVNIKYIIEFEYNQYL